jgi:hypothetical protein
MTDRFNAGFVNAAYVGAKSPNAPTSAVAAKLNTAAEITFTAPTNTGGTGIAITGYRATSTPGNVTGTAATSPITVTGLTNGVSYTFQVTAINAFGESPGSNVTNAVTPSLEGQQLYTGGYYTFVVPIGITSVSVVCVGGGGAGGYYSQGAGAGGGLRYKNSIAVTPGQSIAIYAPAFAQFGSAGGDAYFGTNGVDAFYFFAGGGGSNTAGTIAGGTGSTIGGAADGGGNGGSSSSAAGGGAGGYSGNGGNSGGSPGASGSAGSGGGGGGGYAVSFTSPYGNYSGSGGGVGVLGQGSNGAGGYGTAQNTGSGGVSEPSKQGQGGSGGLATPGALFGIGGNYGGGGGGIYGYTENYTGGGAAAVRIIYPASGGAVSPRVFPSTNTGDV